MKTCSVSGCTRNTHGRDMCVTHRRRAYKGSPLDKPIRTRDESPEFILNWIRLNTKPNPNTGCVEWVGKLDREGYARMNWKGKSWPVHRLMMHLATGKELGRSHVLHQCDNRKCCNLEHLRTGTHQENIQDCVTKGRNAKGQNAPGAKLTQCQVDEIRRRGCSGESTRSIAKDFPVSLRQVQSILAGEYWTTS